MATAISDPPVRDVAPLPPIDGEHHLWRRLSNARDQRAREELVRRYLPLCERLASRYRTADEPFDDLRQVARLGLLGAVDRFDPDRGIPFPAFAAPTILGELRRHFRDRAWTIRLPRGLHDLSAEIEKAVESLTRELQRPPSVAEIAERLGIDAERVLEALASGERRRPLSLDHPLGPDEEAAPMAERIGGEDAGFELTEDRMALREELQDLDERERTVLHLRFVEEMTQSEIAVRLGCSQMQISRLLRAILSRLRERVEALPEHDDGGPRSPERALAG